MDNQGGHFEAYERVGKRLKTISTTNLNEMKNLKIQCVLSTKLTSFDLKLQFQILYFK